MLFIARCLKPSWSSLATRFELKHCDHDVRGCQAKAGESCFAIVTRTAIKNNINDKFIFLFLY